MEPVRHGRDDPAFWPARTSASPPQWSPSVTDGMTGSGAPPVNPDCAPQWSPSVTDGMTRNTVRLSIFHQLAAMEPVRHGRDDPTAMCSPVHSVRAAMEPVRHGRDDDGAMTRLGPAHSTRNDT